MLFIFVPVCNTGAMDDNNTGNNLDRVKLRRVSKIVRCERAVARTTRSQVNDNSFDGLQPLSS